MKEKSKYNHGEAFCLMLYKCEYCGVIEVLWNSRDGVTPFLINCRSCHKSMRHEHWKLDTCIENFEPWHGMRIFVDQTLEEYKKDIARYVYSQSGTIMFQELGMSNYFSNKEEAICQLTRDFRQGQPGIKIVGEQ